MAVKKYQLILGFAILFAIAVSTFMGSIPAVAAAENEAETAPVEEPKAAWLSKFDWNGNGNNLDLSKLQVGDIILADGVGGISDLMPGKYEHCAIYIGGGVIVEAMPEGVRYNDVEVCHGSDEAAIYRVSTTSSKKTAAKNHNIAQVGKPYDYIWMTWIGGKSAYSSSWYCSELNWAGYYLQGVDIDRYSGWSWTYGYNVAPTEIAYDYQTYKVAHGY